MTHIGIDARLTYYRTGGIPTYIRRLIVALEQLDKRNRYTIFHSRKDETNISERFTRARLWTPAHHRIERFALSMELLPRNLDVYHSPDFIPPYRGAKKHIITIHDLSFLHYPQYLTADSRRYYNTQIEAACHHADHILAVSEATKRDIMHFLQIAPGKITVQPHGVDQKFHPLTDAEVQKANASLHLPCDYILHVGTWEPRKNILGLLKAYRLVLDDFPDAPPLVLVGRAGWLFEETQSQIEQLNLNNYLIWRDDIADAQLPVVYNMARVLVSPSFYEGFGMPALEAMACGTVPIVSNLSSFPEVVGTVGLRIDPHDSVDIAAALKQTLTDDNWLQQQSRQAMERAALFTWEKSAQIALTTYTSTS